MDDPADVQERVFVIGALMLHAIVVGQLANPTGTMTSNGLMARQACDLADEYLRQFAHRYGPLAG